MIEKLFLMRNVAHSHLMERASTCENCILTSNLTDHFCPAHTGLYIAWQQLVATTEGQQSQGVLS